MQTEILLYDYVSDDGWFQSFNCIGCGNLSAGNVIAQIEAANGQELLVRINSVGGSVFDGFAIYNSLKAHNAKVTVRIDGLAASIASIIAMAGEEIIICQASMMMVHKPTIDPFWCGAMDADDLQREANALTQIESVLLDIYASKTSLGTTKLQNMIDAETWLTPDIAVSLGFATSKETLAQQPEMAAPAFNHLFKNVNPSIKAYANNAFKINNMSNPNEAILNAVNENTKKTNGLLDWFQNKFNWEKGAAKNASATLANGNAIYFNDGEALAAGTKVYEDEDQSTPLADGDYDFADNSKMTVVEGAVESMTEPQIEPDNSAEIAALNTQIEELRNQLNSQNTALETANSTLQRLKDIKSTYKPKGSSTEFNTQGEQAEVVATASDLVERVRNRKNKA